MTGSSSSTIARASGELTRAEATEQRHCVAERRAAAGRPWLTTQTVAEPRRAASTAARLRELATRSRSALMTYVGVGSVLVIFSLWLAATEPTFATYDNFVNILNTNAVLLVAAIGLTIVLLVGGFDLSIGGVLALSGVGAAKLISMGVPPGSAVVLRRSQRRWLSDAFFNGVLIARLGLSFFVVTLGTASLFGGAALADQRTVSRRTCTPSHCCAASVAARWPASLAGGDRRHRVCCSP